MQILNRGVETAKHDTQEIHEALQAERGQVLDQVRALQLAARLLVQAEARRLAARRPDDQRVATLRQVDRTVQARIALLDTEREVAAIRVPPVSKTEALVHGRITDEAQRAAGRVSVVLVGADGRAVQGVNAVEVDDSGYYAFVIDAQTAATLGADTPLSVAVQRGEATVVPASTAGFTLATGAVSVKDVALSKADLEKLQLRNAATVATTSTTRAQAAQATANAPAAANVTTATRATNPTTPTNPKTATKAAKALKAEAKAASSSSTRKAAPKRGGGKTGG
jgi:hypothetical protein